jgi:predicted MFS family arabinose efflux permease
VRRSVVFIYLAIFFGEVVWTALVPLVPTYSERFGLSKLDGGMLLASASLTILAASVPATILSERFGARAVTLAAVALMGASDLGQGLANGFWLLLLARMVFGIAFGTLWVTGVAWLAETAGDRQARALSLTVTTAGVGGVAGPAFAGIVVERFGLAAPFSLCAGATVVVAAAMAVTGSKTGQRLHGSMPLRATLRNAVASRLIMSSLLLMTLGGLIGSAINLLAPLQLHRNGLSSAAIGLAFSVSAVAFIASSAIVARFGERAARITVGATSALLMASALVLVVVSDSTPTVVTFLLARAPISALMFTITFPLGVVGARRAGVGLSAVAALLNMVWAAAALVGPILAATIAQATSARTTYLVLIVVSLASSAWLATSGRRDQHQEHRTAERLTACRATGR